MSTPTPPPSPVKVSTGKRIWLAVLNVAERAGSTFVESFLSVFALSSALNLDAIEAAGISAIPAGIAVISNALGAWLQTDNPVKPTWLDYVERFGATFGQTFLGVLIVAHHYDLSELEIAGAAALASALAIVKGGVAQLTGSKTAALFGPLTGRHPK